MSQSFYLGLRFCVIKGDVKRNDNTLRKHVNNKVYHNIDIVT